MPTVERRRTTRTEAAQIMPFGGWQGTPAQLGLGDSDTFFRFPAPDDPAPATARLLGMSLFAAALGLAGLGVGVCGLVTAIGGAAAWHVPVLTIFGLLSVAAAVASFLSIHRPALPWLLLSAATVPLAADILLVVLY